MARPLAQASSRPADLHRQAISPGQNLVIFPPFGSLSVVSIGHLVEQRPPAALPRP